MGRYKFNKDQLKFVEDKIGLKGWSKKIVKYFVVSVLLAVLYYIAISLVFSTDHERRLSRENKLMEQEYERLQEKIEVLDNTVKNLQVKDVEIYSKIFNSQPPSFYIRGSSSFFDGMDTTINDKIIDYSAEAIDKISGVALLVSKTIEGINNRYRELGDSIRFIPSIIPVKEFSVSQTGASIGQKINPFYKTVVNHTGMDLLGATGADIVATANGTVTSVSRKSKKDGNTVEIDHGNGYITRYLQMGDIIVRERQKVVQGTVIGRVGLSGMSFAPHLHYEVIYNGEVLDPVNFFYADLTPELYREIVTIASNTGQSMD